MNSQFKSTPPRVHAAGHEPGSRRRRVEEGLLDDHESRPKKCRSERNAGTDGRHRQRKREVSEQRNENDGIVERSALIFAGSSRDPRKMDFAASRTLLASLMDSKSSEPVRSITRRSVRCFLQYLNKFRPRQHLAHEGRSTRSKRSSTSSAHQSERSCSSKE